MPTESIGYLTVDVARLLRRRFEARLDAAGFGLTAGEARTLYNAGRSGPVRQAALAERMAVEPMTLVGYLDRLERAGLIRRLPDPADRRAKLVVIEPAAAGTMGEISAIAEAVRAEATAGLTDGEADALRRALSTMRQNLCGGLSPAEADAPDINAADRVDRP